MPTKTEKAPLVECFVTHALGDPETGGHLIVRAGTKWRADSAPAAANPEFFHDPDLPEDERPNWRAFIQSGVTSGRQFSKRTRLVVTQTTRVAGSVFEEGKEFTAPPEIAEILVNQGSAAVIE
jgi:hypothetical protein